MHLEPGQFDWLDGPAVFVFIGRDPNSGWHEGSGVPGSDKGFTVTGRALGRVRRETADLKERDPALRETRVAGIFAACDVRLGSTKHVVRSPESERLSTCSYRGI